MKAFDHGRLNVDGRRQYDPSRWNSGQTRTNTTSLSDEVVEISGKDVKVGDEYVVGLAVGYDRFYDRIINLDNNNNDRSPCCSFPRMSVLSMNVY